MEQGCYCEAMALLLYLVIILALCVAIWLMGLDGVLLAIAAILFPIPVAAIGSALLLAVLREDWT